MSLSIVGGRFRNRKLKSPKGATTRPTSAILRKSTFDICKNIIEGARFLDLFAGSGAMGLEALSRDAAQVTFVEQDRQALRCIHENIELLEVSRQSRVMMGDALAVLKKLQKLQNQFDLIYIDPPYKETELVVQILKFIDGSDLISSEGIVFIEEGAPSKFPKDLALNHLMHKDDRRFGSSILHQYVLKS